MKASWFFKSGFHQGAFWACLTALISVLNDVVTRQVGSHLPGSVIGFFRYFFSTLTVVPFMLRRDLSGFKTSHPKLHIYRAVLGAAAILCSTYAVLLLPLNKVTTFSFTQPIFVLVLASLFLNEKIKPKTWAAVILGFFGIATAANFLNGQISFQVFIPMGAAFLFACLDILAKKMVSSERFVTMLFYFGLGTTIFGLGPALYYWVEPSLNDLFWLVLLGAGANLIQVCLFMAFAATTASSLAPFRYVEFVFAAAFGYLFFHESVCMHTVVGMVLIIISTLYITYRRQA